MQENLGESRHRRLFMINWQIRGRCTQQLQTTRSRTLIGEVDLAVHGPLAAKTRDALIGACPSAAFSAGDRNSAKTNPRRTAGRRIRRCPAADSNATIDAEDSARLRLRYVSGLGLPLRPGVR